MQRIDVSDNGVMLTTLHSNVKHKRNFVRRKRGCISGWSCHSRSRFRRFLFEYSGSGDAFGVTCTLPFSVSIDDWYDLVERFRVLVARAGFSGVWRVELQNNSNPHLHCVFWLGSFSDGWSIVNCWLKAISGIYFDHPEYGVISGDYWPGAVLYSCKVQRASDFCLWRYLCDHATKRKQAQLGFRGRQWGVFNRSGLHRNSFFGFFLSDSEFDKVLRCLRRLTHSKVSRGRGGKSVWFTDPKTLDRLVAFFRDGMV